MKDTLSITDAAELLGVTAKTMQRWDRQEDVDQPSFVHDGADSGLYSMIIDVAAMSWFRRCLVFHMLQRVLLFLL